MTPFDIFNKKSKLVIELQQENKLINKGIPSKAIVHESLSQNTREQAIEIIKMAKLNGWNKLILVASHYHQYRAYLTFLKEVLKMKNQIAIQNLCLLQFLL